MQGLEPNCRMDGTSRMARAEEEKGRSWRPTRMSGGPEKSAAIQGVQPLCTPSDCLVTLAPGKDVGALGLSRVEDSGKRKAAACNRKRCVAKAAGVERPERAVAGAELWRLAIVSCIKS